MEKASGLRQATCPWQALRDPFVCAVLDAYRWRDRLPMLYGSHDMPEAVRRGLDVYEAALNAVLAHDRRVELERQRAETAAAHPGEHRGRRRFPSRKSR